MIKIKRLTPVPDKKQVSEVLECLQQLYDTSETKSSLAKVYVYLQSKQGCETFVAYDTKEKRIVGVASVFIMYKLLHECGRVALIEDVAVRPSHQGKGIGKLLIEACEAHAVKRKCYKTVLYCEETVIPFYERCNYYQCCTLMRKDHV